MSNQCQCKCGNGHGGDPCRGCDHAGGCSCACRGGKCATAFSEGGIDADLVARVRRLGIPGVAKLLTAAGFQHDEVEFTEPDGTRRRGVVLPTRFDESVPQQKGDSLMDTKEMLEQLGQLGFDTGVMATAPDPVLAEVLRVVQARSQPEDDQSQEAAVKQFAERPAVARALKLAGSSPTQHVEKFRELRKKDRSMTARRYGCA